nr:hypothetical protein CFP56_35566 [Quercus suber]
MTTAFAKAQDAVETIVQKSIPKGRDRAKKAVLVWHFSWSLNHFHNLEDLKEPPRLPEGKKKFKDNPKEKKILPEGKSKGPPRILEDERRFSEGNPKERTSLPKRGKKILSGEYSKEAPGLPEEELMSYTDRLQLLAEFRSYTCGI